MRWRSVFVLLVNVMTGCGGSYAMQSARAAMPPPAMQPMAPAPEAPGGASDEAAPATASTAASTATGATTRAVDGPAQRHQGVAPGVPGGPAGDAGNRQGAQGQQGQQAAQQPAPMLIYTATVDLQTPREAIPAAIDRVIEAATAMGGYLLSRTDTTVQVRVPSARFREASRRVEEFGEVLHRSVSAQDVSEEFHDAEVRLANLRAVRRRLEEFLTRAGNMAEALQVERELERVSREIDALEGRLRFLSSRVAFSLITVNVHARPEPSVVAAPPPPPMPPRQILNLPVSWLHRLGLERLLNVSE